MIRLAYFSPVNPVESGISDYSEELLPWLAQGAEIDLFVDNYRPSNPEIRRRFSVHRGKEFEARQRQRQYDAVLYHMGNSPAHAYIYHTLLKHRGIVVLHDYLLHHLMIWLAINKKRGQAYQREMETRYGSQGLGVARRMLKGQLPQAAFDYPLCEGVLKACQGVIVHNGYAEGLIRQAHPELPIGRVNMGVPLPEEARPAEVRQKLGIPEDQFLIVSLGHLNPYKRLDAALRAFKSLVVRHPRAIYVLAGSASPNYDVKRMVD
ncbi:MAG: glycosyl transferase family 1, partial [Chloroflexi bacterium]|nr:glycosyl transferase family 1 [Chloroflexota bacterium]